MFFDDEREDGGIDRCLTPQCLLDARWNFLILIQIGPLYGLESGMNEGARSRRNA